MNRQKKPQPQRLFLAAIVGLAILLLLLRLFVFTHGRQHRFRTATSAPAAVYVASLTTPAKTTIGWNDRFYEGTPDFLCLTDLATLEVQP